MKNVEQLFPQFEVVNIVKQNQYKKSLIVKRSGYYYMLRIFTLEGIPKERVQSIIKILSKISNQKSPHIVKFYEASLDQDMNYLGYWHKLIIRIVSDYLDKQPEYPMQERDIWKAIQEISQTLQLFHPKRVHGKLQLSNLFQNQKNTILGEMNILYYLHQHSYTDAYLLAPEFIRTQIYDYKSDIWMFGYMLYQMMFKDPLIVANNTDVLHKKILKGIHITYNPNYSLNLNNLLRLMLCYDPELRPNTEQISNYCTQALVSQEEINLNRILPKFKTDKLVLHKRRIEKQHKPVENIVYLSEDHYKQPYFPPSKVRKQNKKSQSKQLTSASDFHHTLKSMHSLSLPKVMNYQFSALKIKDSLDHLDILQTKSPIQKLQIDSLIKLQKNIVNATQRNQIAFNQQEQMNKQKSQRVFF
ncbi:unnamed protein product (macronuclear) [Paramecium tetraurelia]|uniref:Protein kinase domain-containing protein n=1 Tax=Paramecium tetraurelia TaxID=5888 RepID=A0C3P2_PARTE|nr:uncharacterized protein GSPATT00034888001 [Paramecium tetraurelia]CAK65409.1 unnamed protein product [Paramecium tetraurelia]|eukprot:XP_001432806.1 hypothetical protein (macronuclear) [Paramecium tetraurelia strain d4-2]